MTNLFIIGNGFDIAHRMETYYSDFRKFLISTYLENEEPDDNFYCDIPYPTENQDGEEIYNDREAAEVIVKLIDKAEPQGNTWKEVEKSLGELNYDEYLDDFGLYNDKDIKDTYYRNEDNARYLCGAVKLVGEFFQEWIGKIKPAKILLEDFKKLINPDEDLFLNFNYTDTLQHIYKAKHVCHIHGTKDTLIYFGHGREDFRTEEFKNKNFGSENELNSLHRCLKKDTKNAYSENKDFFQKTKRLWSQDVFKIYFYGFSFSEVDECYLQHLFENVQTDKACICLNDHDKEKLAVYEKKLRKHGFKGRIESFHIDGMKIQYTTGLFRLFRRQAQRHPDKEQLTAPEKPISAY